MKNVLPNDEMLDLVDENDHVIDQKWRSEVYALKLHNFRAVNAFIINSQGQLWIPRRVANKRVNPLCLDMSMGGHVPSGETYEQAFAREVEEELRLDVSRLPVCVLGTVSPQTHQTYCWSRVYEIRSDKVPDYNPEDFFEYFWLTPQELLDRIDGGDPAKYDLPILIRTFYS